MPEPTGPFTDEIKQKVRAHYAAEVLQIDHEVGQILAALEERGMLDNTIVIFSSDHGEMAGDHNMRGKGNFYEPSCHVPMLVRWPGRADPGTVRDDLVTLTDVTATMLASAGCEVPSYMDSQPLPGLGLPGESSNDMLVGFLQGAWMAFDGRHKLCKYASGFQGLFDLDNDPQEIDNLSQSADHADLYRHLDAAMWRDVMRSSLESHHYNRVDGHNGLWADKEYGRRGQQRPYPVSLSD
ncbi:MAG: sulfatase-like hydrolase/transferase [Gemmatimonadetes bacterium]|nr:sulfatase-like hydrolase/transferase [Gemmatimonadota bacterium]